MARVVAWLGLLHGSAPVQQIRRIRESRDPADVRIGERGAKSLIHRCLIGLAAGFSQTILSNAFLEILSYVR